MYLYQDLNRYPIRNPCLGCKQSIESRPMGKGCFVPLFRFHSQKPTSKRRFSKHVEVDYSCSNYHGLVWALRYYLDRTKDQRSRSFLFISFKKGHTTDIRPATLSSWLKQAILLCYKQADQQALDLVQVKAHDIRAFVASKAFYGGVSVDQIMQACHWKAHNRQRQQYVSGTSSSSTTSPRPFPSDCSSSERGAYLL